MSTRQFEFKKAFISFRIGDALWMSDKRFDELIGLFEKYKGVTDEITFFISCTHAPMTLEQISERASLLKERMQQLRRLGYRSGINILATIGHHEENLPNSFSGSYTHMTDIDGNLCLGANCPNDMLYLKDYVVPLYEIITNAKPDYIWIDDDVRLFGHLPITAVCFCDNCLSIFKSEFGTEFSRESLNNAFNEDKTENKLKIRMDWLKHNRNTIARLLRRIETVVHGIEPSMLLGFMTGERFYEGYDFDSWAEILSGTEKAEVLWRPGGGFYSDKTMDDLTEKSHQIGRQVSLLNDSVVSIQSEIENFPYDSLNKASHTTALEAASHIAAGCTGTAFNVLAIDALRPLSQYEPLVSKLCQARAFLDLMVQNFGREKPVGLYGGWSKDSFASRNIKEGNWIGNTGVVPGTCHVEEILQLGIPAAYSPESASVTAISGESVLAIGSNEIEKMLSGAVYMDAEALCYLNKMGYQELTGFSIVDTSERDCIEQFTEHPINGSFGQIQRDGRQSFSGVFGCSPKAYFLQPQKEKAEILSRLLDYTGREVAPCSMGLFENHKGGRVCVSGYYAWNFLHNLSKSSQIKSVMRWLSKEDLPAYIASFHRINMWVRTGSENQCSLSLINASHDPAEEVVLKLITNRNKISVFDMDCSEMEINSHSSDGPYREFILPTISPWHMQVIISE